MLIHTLADQLPVFLAQFPPNPAPAPPPGGAADKITQVVGMIKWGAGLALIAGFFGGLAAFTGGRIADHHRVGRVGTMMMMSSVAGGILYAVGYPLITSFAGGG